MSLEILCRGVNVLGWVDRAAVVDDFVVQVWSGRISGISDESDQFSSNDLLTLFAFELRKVAVNGLETVSVIDNDDVTQTSLVPGKGDRAVRCHDNRCSNAV